MFQLKARVILGLLIFGMFFLYQMSRFNISLAIVAIARTESLSNSTSSFDSKPLLLGAFFWMGWITELSGALIIDKFGCRRVMIVAYLINAVCSLLFSMTYQLHPICAVIVRMIQGLALGVTWPGMGWISARWIPKHERSRFLSAFHGSSLGGSVTNLVGGVIIHTYGWSYIFHLTGVLCLAWVVLWWVNVFDLPTEHPRISAQELEYLQIHVEMDTSKQKKVSLQTPWLDIFTSTPFLAVSSVFFAMMWFNVTLALQLPTYLDMTHHLNIKTNGYLLSIPDIAKVLVGISFPVFVDNLVKKKKITITFARRLSSTIGQGVPGILLILLAYYGYTSLELTVVLIVLIISISGCGSSSYIANVVDISPNHSGSLMGFLKTISSLPGIISPIIIKYMIADDSANWRSVFLITSLLVIASAMIFLFFSSTDIQPWNNKIQMEPVKAPENEDLLMLKIKIADKEEHKTDNYYNNQHKCVSELIYK